LNIASCSATQLLTLLTTFASQLTRNQRRDLTHRTLDAEHSVAADCAPFRIAIAILPGPGYTTPHLVARINTCPQTPTPQVNENTGDALKNVAATTTTNLGEKAEIAGTQIA